MALKSYDDGRARAAAAPAVHSWLFTAAHAHKAVHPPLLLLSAAAALPAPSIARAPQMRSPARSRV